MTTLNVGGFFIDVTACLNFMLSSSLELEERNPQIKRGQL
jgi:hypothetical protein